MQILLVIFWLGLTSLSAWGANAPGCLQRLQQSDLAQVYPALLGVEFNDVYQSHHGEGGNKLRSIFNFLEISGARGSDASATLQSIFSHMYREQNFVDRYYPDYSELGRGVRTRLLYTFEARLYLLSRMLEGNQVKRDPRLLDRLIAVALEDFNPVTGFTARKDHEVVLALQRARQDYAQAPSVEPDAGSVWRDSADDAPEGSLGRLQSSVPQFPRDQVVILPGENADHVLRALDNLQPESYQHAREKAYLENFDEFSEVPTYAFFIIHNGNGNPHLLLNVYERGLEFFEREIVTPQFGALNENKGPRVKTFLSHLRKTLDGSLEFRFGVRFKNMAKERFERPLKEIRQHLDHCSNHAELFADPESLRDLNTCFAAVGIPPFNP